MKIKFVLSSFLISSATFFSLSNGVLAQSEKFILCQKKFLGGKLIADFINDEATKEDRDEKYIEELKRLQKKQSCFTLLNQAKLKKNGLLENRTPLSSQILETFVTFHKDWITPKDFDQSPNCREGFEKDIFDPRTPAYHLTRALFQEDRKASLAITSYGDLRGVRKGENPKTSTRTNLSNEDYQKILGLEEPFDLTGDAPLIGFLFKRAVSWSNVANPQWSQTNKSWDKSREKGKFRLYHHQGAGLLGSPSFLLHYAPKGVEQKRIYKSDGQGQLPRKLAQGIIRNILCLDPLSFKAPADLPDYQWNHPITKETQCLNCHYSLDQMAAGLRHLTYLKSRKTCDGTNVPQLLVPSSFETSYTMDLWQGLKSQETSTNEDKSFSFSYPVGYFQDKRFVGFNQLGRLLSEGPQFYSCQVKRYFEFFHGKPIDSQNLERLTKNYQEDQNGLNLMKKIMALKPRVIE